MLGLFTFYIVNEGKEVAASGLKGSPLHDFPISRTVGGGESDRHRGHLGGLTEAGVSDFTAV